MEFINLEDEISIEEIEQLERQFVKRSELQNRVYKSNKKIRYIDYLMWIGLDCYDTKNTFFTSNNRSFNYEKLVKNIYKKIKTDDLIDIIDRAKYFFEYTKPKKEFIKNDPYFLFLSDDKIYLDYYNVYEDWGLVFNELNIRKDLDKLSKLNLNALMCGWKHNDNLEHDEKLRYILIDVFLYCCKEEKNINDYNAVKGYILESLENLDDGDDDYEPYNKKLSNVVNYFLAINNVMFNIENKDDLNLLKQNNILDNNIIPDKVLMSYVNLINEKLLNTVKVFLEENDNSVLKKLIDKDNELKDVISPVFSFSVNYLASNQKESKVGVLVVLKDFEELLRKSIFNEYFDLLRTTEGNFYIVNKKAINENGNAKDDCEKFLDNLFKHPKIIKESDLENLNSIIEKNIQKVLISENNKKSKKMKF